MKVLITLTDHNDDKEFGLMGQIVEVVDHHKQSPFLKRISYPLKVTIDESVGSCSTLVAERLFEHPELVDARLALLIYGPIILGINTTFSTMC